MNKRRKSLPADESHFLCPCGSGQTLAACCARYHAGADTPPDAATLMRSRYTAFVLEDAAYLAATWHDSTRPEDFALEPGERTRWLGLEVRRHEETQDAAVVEFVARYKIGGRAHRMHEISRFVREEGRWLYVDGDVQTS